MSDTLIACLVTGGINLIGIVLSNSSTREKIVNMLKVQDAVQDERIKQLKASVDKHNHFAERIPKVETEILDLEKRIDRLERKE
jgi:predicted RecB family endonuclease